MNLVSDAIPGRPDVHQHVAGMWEELKLKLQAEVYKKSIRLQDFLFPFDRHRRGSVIEPNFQRALAAAGITMTSDDMFVIRTKFGMTETSQALISYYPFLNAINTVFGPLNLEQNPNQEIIDGQKLTADYEHKIALSLRQPDKLSPQELSLMKHTMQRIKDRIFKLRFDPSSKFRDFDKFNSGNVSKVQFHKCLTAIGFNFNIEIINLLCRQYTSGRHIDHVDYRKFLADITQGAARFDSMKPNHKKSEHLVGSDKIDKPAPVNIESVLEKLKEGTSRYSVRFFDYLRDADPLRKNAITKSRLAAVLSSIGDIILTDEETALLQREFPHAVERDQINYQTLSDSIQSWSMPKSLENPLCKGSATSHQPGIQSMHANCH